MTSHSKLKVPNLVDVDEAAERICESIHHTSVCTSQSINKIAGAEIYFKCENLQKAGAFKARGATNAVLALADEAAARGVATHSSGNHAAALARAAALRGVSSKIVMPRTSPRVKIAAVRGYGAEITFCEPTLAARESALAEVIAASGATFIHPYNDWRVVAGQGTAARELLAQVPNLEIVMAPVGGGGLLSGTAIAAADYSPGVEVIGAEPAGADDAYRSLQLGYIVPSLNPSTIADGLLTSLGELTFSVLRSHQVSILRVSDSATVTAMRYIMERMKLVVEPSAAVPLAAVLEHQSQLAGKRIGIILSGGNVDLQALPWRLAGRKG
jgi:threonine dehydratase